jgi:hypothetical protein
MDCRRWLVSLVVVTVIGGPIPARTEDQRDQLADRARLAESVLRRAEGASGRALDPTFRRGALASLAQLPVEELSAREPLAAARGLGPLALGDAAAQLVFTPVPACRIADTRLAGGALAAGAGRDFKVTGSGLQGQGGSAAGCGVPNGAATSAIINFVAVNPTGPGNLRAWAYSEPAAPPPNASILNYPFGLNIANAIAVPLCDITQTTCSFDIKVQADANATHLVADVVGYFERFPKELVRSFTVTAPPGVVTPIAATCTHVGGSSLSLTAPVPGKVVVRAVAPISLEHGQGVTDVILVGIGQTETDCAFGSQGIGRFSVASPLPSHGYQVAVPASATFEVTAGTHSFHLNAYMFQGVGGTDVIFGDTASLEATFHPN